MLVIALAAALKTHDLDSTWILCANWLYPAIAVPAGAGLVAAEGVGPAGVAGAGVVAAGVVLTGVLVLGIVAVGGVMTVFERSSSPSWLLFTGL